MGTMKTVSEEKAGYLGWKVVKHLRPRIKNNSFRGITYDIVWTAIPQDGTNKYVSASTLGDLKFKVEMEEDRKIRRALS